MGTKKLKQENGSSFFGLKLKTIKLKTFLLFAVFLCMALPAWAGMNEWTSLGPEGGRIGSIAISPNYANDRTVFAAASDRTFKSTDGGTSWHAVDSGLSDISIGSLAISPSYANDQTIYAGVYGRGVFKSTDGGINWTAVNTGLSYLGVTSLAISPNYSTDQTVYAGMSNGGGIFKSTNGGTSWSAVNTGLNPNWSILSLSISPNYASDQTIYAGTNAAGVFKSTDGGMAWDAVNTGITSTIVPSLAISPNYASDRTVFATTNFGNLFKTTDGGMNWGAVGAGIPYVEDLAVSPSYASDQTVYATTNGGGVYKSTDEGMNWCAVNAGITSMYPEPLAISPNYASDQTVYVGTWVSVGIFRTTNGGASWDAVNTGLNSMDIYSIAISPNYTNDQAIFAGTYYGSIYRSLDSGASWSGTGDSYYVYSFAISPNYATDQTVYAVTFSSSVLKSTNGGLNWSDAGTGITYPYCWSLAISSSYTNDQTLYAGTSGGGVFKSTNGGISWSAVNSGLTSLSIPSLAVSPDYANDQTVFAGTGGGLFKSTNGGTSWNVVNTELTSTYPGALAISPNYANDQTVFAGTSIGGVFKSTNGGTSWTAVNTGLTDLSISSVTVSPDYANDRTVYAGTAGGVFKSTDEGISWTAINTGLTNLYISSLAVSPDYANGRTIYAGTHGRGVFSYTFPAVDLPRTGQTKCYDTAGTEIDCSGTGQDGEIQAGVPWPEPRFTDNSDGTITDNLTGLMWTRDAGTPTAGACTGGMKTWQESLDYVACLNNNNYLGHSNWRLPNVNEIESFLSHNEADQSVWLNGQGFTNVQSSQYWSSTTFASNPLEAWYISMGGVDVRDDNKLTHHYVWPVCSSSSLTWAPTPVWQTGQTVCYDESGVMIDCTNTGQDGDTLSGISWPTPRFTDNNNGTVTDNLSGLMWLKDANCIATHYPGFDNDNVAGDGQVTWQHSLDFVAGINNQTYSNCGAGYTDWRLPNRKEVHSLFDKSRYNPALPPNPFINVQGWLIVWTSTTDMQIGGDTWNAMTAELTDGVEGRNDKSSYAELRQVWPVRGGTVVEASPPVTTASPIGGTYASAQSVTLTCNDGSGSGCQTTYYCLGSGCNPTTVYSVPINISSSTDLRFYSTDNAGNSETVKTETYTINIPPPVTCSLTPGGATLLSRGSNLNFFAAAQNNTDQVQVFQFATRITLPNFNTYPSSGWLLGPITVSLNPHESKSKLMTQFIPYNAPFGSYTYRGYVGTVSPPLLYNQCTFNFSVNP